MSELTVQVNKQEYKVPDTVDTLSGFLEAVNYTNGPYKVYRIDRGEEQRLTGEMFVFDEGDEFVVIPKYINGG